MVWIEIYDGLIGVIAQGYHPHGWCGLKLKNKDDINYCQFVTTHTGGADKIILLKIYKLEQKQFPFSRLYMQQPNKEKTKKNNNLLVYDYRLKGYFVAER